MKRAWRSKLFSVQMLEMTIITKIEAKEQEVEEKAEEIKEEASEAVEEAEEKMKDIIE